MTPTKVTWIIDDLGLGGAQRQLSEIAKLLSPKYSLEVVSLSDVKCDYEKNLRDAGIPLTLIPQKGKWSWSTLTKLSDYLRTAKPKIVQTWLFTADLYGRLMAYKHKIPIIISAIRNTTDDMPWHYRLVNRILASGTTCFTVNADMIRKGLIQHLGIPDRKIRTIYNGINLKEFPLTNKQPYFFASLGIPENAKIFAMAARMAPQKDYFTYLAAAKNVLKQFPDTYFLLIGEGPLREKIEFYIQGNSLQERIKLLGARRDVWQILNQIDYFVLSTHFEGCSNVIMEAMAAGKPVIATNVGGNPELVEHRKTGLIVAHEDIEQLADAMISLILQEKASLSMGEAARTRVETFFTLENTVRNTEQLYEELLRARHERH